MNPPKDDKLFESILASASALVKAADAGTAYTRRALREGEASALMTDLLIDPDLKPVCAIAQTFARLVAERAGLTAVKLIDELNNKGPVDVCRSHDFCDANEFMNQALCAVLGLHHDPEEQSHKDQELFDKLWSYAWRYTKVCGFHRLSAVRGDPDNPPETYKAKASEDSLAITLPRLTDPVEIGIDFWGRDPHLQVLCWNQKGEIAIHVRYDKNGRVVEVFIEDPNILVVGAAAPPRGGRTPWELEREANPVCSVGDKLMMPSGQVADVMRLQERYAGIEEFRAYDANYGVLARLDKYPGNRERETVFESIEQAWEVNPLTAGTTEPADLSIVPEIHQL